MGLVSEHGKNTCNNGKCSGCGNNKAIIYWQGAEGIGLCKNCIHHLIPRLIADYVIYRIRNCGREFYRTEIVDTKDVVNELLVETYYAIARFIQMYAVIDSKRKQHKK
jgi:hypothetical protein